MALVKLPLTACKMTMTMLKIHFDCQETLVKLTKPHSKVKGSTGNRLLLGFGISLMHLVVTELWEQA